MNDVNRQEPTIQMICRRSLLGIFAISAYGACAASETKARSLGARAFTRTSGASSGGFEFPGASVAVDAQQPGENRMTSGPRLDQPIVIRWRYDELTVSYSEFTLTDGRLYIGQGGGIVTVLEAATGDLVWSESIGAFYEVTTPQVSDGMVYFSTNDRPGSSIQAVDADSGQEIWRFNPQSAGVTRVTVKNGVLYAGAEGALHALDALTGDVRWKTEPAGIGYDAQPVLIGNLVLIKNWEGYLIAIDMGTGTEVSRVFVGAGPGGLVSAGRIYLSGEGQEVLAVDANDGSLVWRQSLSGEPTNSSVVDEVVYWSAHGVLYALDANTGGVCWRFSSGLERVLDGYAVADEIVYIVGENLYALDASSGLEYWRYPLDTSSLIHTTRLVAGDGRIFLTYNVNSLLAIGNLGLARLLTDVTLRSTPSGSGAERGSARAGDEISRLGERLERGGFGWVEVTINNVTGWIPLDVIDPASLPPEGEIDYVYTPA